MGLFDDIADVYTGAKTAKQVRSPSLNRAIKQNENVRKSFERAAKRGAEVRDNAKSEAERRGVTVEEILANRGIKTQDQQVRDLSQRQIENKITSQDTSGDTSAQTGTTTTTTDDDDTRKNKFLSSLLGVPINQLSPQDLAKVKKILDDYEKNKLNVNIAQLRSLMVSNIAGGVFGKDQTFTDRDGNRVDPDKVIDKGDGRLFYINEKGEQIDVRRTREGVIEQLEGIDSNIMESLKKFNPEIYYPFAGSPQTSGGLVDLARLDATKFGSRTLPDGSPNPDYNPDFANQIFAARQELQRMDKNPFTGTSTRDEGLGQLAQGPATPLGSGKTPPPNPGDLIFRTMYRPNFTPSYTGGPEQIQLAGGFFDPRTQQVVYDPYGTANQYRFPTLPPNIAFSKGGIANFKDYGY